MSVLVGPDRPQYNISDSQSDVKITVRSHSISLAGPGSSSLLASRQKISVTKMSDFCEI